MKILYTLSTLIFLCVNVNAQSVFQQLKAVIIYLDDYSDKLNSQIELGDTIVGTLSYSLNVTDDNADPAVGDYWNYDAPYGIILHVGGIGFQTDNSNINFLCEAVNYPAVQGGDAIVFRSYNNFYSAGNDATDKVIAWQLDNPDGTNLNSDTIPVVGNLSSWDQVFALTINADDFPDGSNGFFIRATVFEISGEVGTGLSSLSTEDPVRIFPNPVQSRFMIEGPLLNASLQIENLDGKIMMSKTPATSEVDISDLPPGLYVVKIIGEKSMKVFKLMKS